MQDEVREGEHLLVSSDPLVFRPCRVDGGVVHDDAACTWHLVLNGTCHASKVQGIFQ